MLPSIGLALHKMGGITQKLKFKYLYKSHCKYNELLWAFKEYYII
jgi:hypothetical protein